MVNISRVASKNSFGTYFNDKEMQDIDNIRGKLGYSRFKQNPTKQDIMRYNLFEHALEKIFNWTGHGVSQRFNIKPDEPSKIYLGSDFYMRRNPSITCTTKITFQDVVDIAKKIDPNL